MASIGGGMAEGLESVLARLFQEQLEKQRVAEQDRKFGMDERRMAQDQTQFDQRLGFDKEQLGETKVNNEFNRNRGAADTALRGTEFAQRATENDQDENWRQVDMAMRGTEMANQNNQNDLNRRNTIQAANMRVSNQGEPLVSVQGPEGPMLVPRSQAAGMTPASSNKPITGMERTALSFYNRAKEALDILAVPDKNGQSLEDRIANQWIGGQIQGQIAPNMFQTTEQQRYRQAQRAFTEARLRKESGAAIAPLEYENDAKTYFKQPGDAPEVVEQKRIARQEVLDGLAYTSGRAYEDAYGTPPPTMREKASPQAPGSVRRFNPATGRVE